MRGRIPRRVDSIVAWATGPAGARARRNAERRRLPLLTVDDGFVRSLGRSGHGCAPISLVIDPIGIYYDATRPSALEVMLEAGDGGGAPASDDAVRALARLRGERIGRVNTAPELGPGDIDTGQRPLVLVVDQPRDDPSIALGLAGEHSFDTMLDAALDENPDAAVLVVRPAEVACGRQRGHLAERARRQGIAVLDREINPISLVEHAARVYTVTAHLGMEALICGARVTCFGMPYYAGWGATDDRVTCKRRTRRCSPLDIFAAAYLRYARYVDPITGEASAPVTALDRLAVIKRANDRNRGHTECLGFDLRARRRLRPFLASTDGSLGFSEVPAHALRRAAARSGRLCIRAGHAPEELESRARRAGVPLVRVDPGILDALRLGRDVAASTSVTFDRRAMYAEAGGVGELEEILEFEDFDDDLLVRAAALRARVLEVLGRRDPGAPPLGVERSSGRRILVVGTADDGLQVERDADVKSDLELLRLVRAGRRDDRIVFVPGVDVERSRAAPSDDVVQRYCDHVLRSACAHAAIARADEVHTTTSPLGFEALLRGCKVVTYGPAFYAGWGLTEDRLTFPRRTRRLTLDQLVAGALILHPAYVDPRTGLPCDAETVVERLAARPLSAPARHRRYTWQLGGMLRGLVEVARQPG